MCLMYVPVASFDSAGVPPHGMGLTVEGRGHTLHHVGNSFTSRRTLVYRTLHSARGGVQDHGDVCLC